MIPHISICIPAYKNATYLRRLLHSIASQNFKNFEVIITDDSPDNSAAQACTDYSDKFLLHYYKNTPALGTPENWNEAIRKASGMWIKLMHDDDWFAKENALQAFYDATLQKPKCSFFFSAYNNIYAGNNLQEPVYLNWVGLFLLKQSPFNLFKKQYIGNPSCTLIKRNVNLYYDNDFIWVVDFEYYIRVLRSTQKFYYISQVLIHVGLNEDQVTKYTFRKPQVEIPENHMMIEKTGFSVLRNIFVYDYYWRLYRNLGIRHQLEIKKYYAAPLHALLEQMVRFQKQVPVSLLKNGFISKVLMAFNYIISLFRKV